MESFLIPLLIFLLASLFGRLGGNQRKTGREQNTERPQQSKQPQQPGPSQQPWPGSSEPIEDWRDLFDPHRREKETEPAYAEPVESYDYEDLHDEQPQTQPTVQDSVRDFKSVRDNQPVSEQVPPVSVTRSLKQKKETNLALHFHQLTKDEAMKAVVWSEVLGQPRAKRPHRSFSKR